MRHRLVLGCVAVLAGFVLVFARAQNQPEAPKGKVAEGKVAAGQAIRQATEVYASAFNRGDVDGLLSIWAPDAEYVDETGKSTKGVAALGAMYKKVIQEHKGAKVKVSTTAIRMLKDDVAMQDGQSVLTFANGESDVTTFSSVWIKKDGKWLVQIVHDLTPPADANGKTSAGLKDLAWLIGNWVHEDKDMKTTLTGRWLKGDKFLAMDYAVQHKGEEVLALTQIVGWDPTGERLHSWVFDSKGGFGEGAWSRDGNTWTVQTSGVTSDGRQGSGKMLWTYVDEDSFLQEAVDRNLDGQPLPNRKTRYQRVK